MLLYALALAFTPSVSAAPKSPGDNPSFPFFALSPGGPPRLEIGPQMGVLIDHRRALTLELARANNDAWQPINRQSPNFGFTQASCWFRFQLHNRSANVLARFIELPIPFLDDVRLYHFVGSMLQTEYKLGDEQAFAQRAVHHRNFVMPVQLAPGRNNIYLRLASSGTIEAPLRIWDPVQFHAASNDKNLAQGAVIGILLVMVVYNLFVFASTRYINYLYYICFVASYLHFHLTLTG